MKFNQGANSREHKKSPENIYIIPTIRLFYSVIKNNRKVSKKEKRRKAKLEEKKRLCNSDLQNMELVSRNTEPGLIIDLKNWESTEVRAQISVPDTGLQPQHLSLFIPQMKHQNQKRDSQKSLAVLRGPDLLWRREKRPFLLRKRLILARLAAGHVPASLPPSPPGRR